ncbi:MAG: ABC transporter ATP-binding protein [Oscillospiraceae bacterium]|nr:ABC transporter ATP-binding protein [Oscillospiraceae bacterium]
MKKLLRFTKPYLLMLIVCLVLKQGAAILELQIPSALADIIDKAVPLARQSGDTSTIVRYGLYMILFAVTGAGTNLIANTISAFITSKAVRDIRQEMFEKINSLSARQLDGLTTSSAIARLTSDTYNVQNMFRRCLMIGIRGPIMMIGGVFVMLRMDIPLTAILVVVIPCVAYITVHLTKKAIPLHKQRQTVLDRLTGKVQENATGVRVIKALSKSAHEREKFDAVNEELSEVNLRAGYATAALHPLTRLLMNLSLAAVVLFGAFRVDAGLTHPGKIIAFINYFTMILHVTLGLSGVFSVISTGAASAGRIAEVLDMEPDSNQLIRDILPEEDGCALEFREVDFSYNGVTPNLENISFRLEKGQTLGILGATGSGKSTVLNLLLRLYDADSGKILIDGRDVQSIPEEELHAMFGMTFQNDFLVADTVRQNIEFFRELPPGAAEKAAVLAQAKEFIDEKEGGMEYGLAVGGNNLSGGQKQRLLIARAVAEEPKFLILDDASSALDYATDARLRRAIAESLPDTTKIIVAQRVSAIRHADLILVLEDGRVIGKGTHDELMQSCETYRETATIQMEAESEEVTAI